MIVNSPPSAAYMSQLTGSALVQIMACRQATMYTNAGLLSVRPLGQKTQNTKLAIHENASGNIVCETASICRGELMDGKPLTIICYLQ